MKLTSVQRKLVLAIVAITLLASFGAVYVASAQSVTFTQQMSIGSRGAHVSALQSFLATRTSHYPEGLVTGYFGNLTTAAVMRFQCAEEIVCSGSAATTGYGRVGPKTLLQLNLVAGGGVSSGDQSAPVIAAVAVDASASTTALVRFSTNESAMAKVHFAPSPLALFEGSALPGTAVGDASFRMAHVVQLTGLAPNTTYYYVASATDASGNMNLTWPATFRTAQ